MIPIRAVARLGLSAALIFPAAAAAVEVKTTTYEGFRILIISGEFTPDDDPDELAKALVSFAPDVVTFDSPGGSIYPAMEFGRTIRRFGASTLQFRGTECASACSLALLTDGTILVVEYKGQHLAEGAKEKAMIGNLWAEASEGRCLFAMPTNPKFQKLHAMLEAKIAEAAAV